MFSRRGFIRIGAAAAGSLALRPFGLLPAMAAEGPDYRVLVCIFLYGGNDSNNMVVPMDDSSYQAYLSIRGNLALSASELTQPVNSVSNAPYAFHGKLAELASMFSSRELAVVANVGPLVQPLTRAQYQQSQGSIPSNLFSHADQQMQWQTSVSLGHSATGWAGRVADYIEKQGMNPGSFPVFVSLAGNSLLGTGAETSPVAVSPGQSLQLKGFRDHCPDCTARWDALNGLLNSDSGLSLAQAANATLRNSMADAQALDAALSGAPALKTVFPKTGLGAQLHEVAQIISVRSELQLNRQIFFCSLGGFDTHTNEINTHNALYPQLSQAIAAFYDATQELGVAEHVTTFTESDFSRTFQPTSGGGSDHAWGSHHLVLGGAVKGGQIYGQFPQFDLGGPNDTDTRGRWIPTTAVDQYGATLSSWFGVPDDALGSIFENFPNFKSQKLGFLG